VVGRRKTHRRRSSTVVHGVRGGAPVRGGGLPVVAGVVGEVIEVHSVVEELLLATVGSERVRRRLATEDLLAAVEADVDGG
jgi:hypothetical protein